MSLNDKDSAVFMISVLSLSSLIAFLAYAIGNPGLSILSIFTPSLVALVLVASKEGKQGVKALFVDQLITRFRPRWFLVAVAAFPVLGLAAVALHGLFGDQSLGLRTTQLLPQVIVILVISLGEEFGWRGYLLPTLQERHSALVASLVLGVVWALWHFPPFLIGTGVPAEMPFLVFMAWVLLATVVMTWVYNNTGSVLLAIVMHSMANATFNYLPLLPEFVGQLDTFLVFLALLALLATALVIAYGPRHLVRANG